MKMKRESHNITGILGGVCSNRILLEHGSPCSSNIDKKGIDRMTWYKVKNWKFKNYNGKLGVSVVESEKIFENEIYDLVHETLSTSVIDDTIDDYYGDVEICGNKYPSSVALKSTDGPVYDEMRDEICEMKAEEILEELPEKPKYFQAMIEQCKIYWE